MIQQSETEIQLRLNDIKDAVDKKLLKDSILAGSTPSASASTCINHWSI